MNNKTLNYLNSRATYLLCLLILSVHTALCQPPQRPVPVFTGKRTVYGTCNKDFKFAFHKDGQHIILYEGVKDIDGKLWVYATRYNWRTGIPDSVIKIGLPTFEWTA